MKKLLAAVLAFAMFFALAVPAFAAGNSIKFAAPESATKSAKSLTVNTAKRETSSLPVKYPVKADAQGTFYGYIFEGYEDRGLAEFDLATDTVTFLETAFPVDEAIYAGVYYVTEDNAAYYGVVNNDMEDNFYLVRFDDFKTGEYERLSVTPEQIIALAADYTTNTVYGMSSSATLYRVDLNTGVFFELGEMTGMKTDPDFGFPYRPFVMSIDDKGVMYTIDDAGNLYTVDTNTCECSFIGDTGIEPNYVQSMLYDYNTDQLLWFFYTFADNLGGVAAIDRETATATPCTIMMHDREYIAMFNIPEELKLPESSEVTAVNISEEEVEVMATRTVQLYATVEPADAYVANRTVTWTVDDESIAVVSEAGVVTGVKPGEATVTATADNGVSAEVKVTVVDPMNYFGELSDALNKVGRDEEGYMIFATYTEDDGFRMPFTAYELEDGRTVGLSGTHGNIDTLSMFQTLTPIHIIGGSTISFDYKLDGYMYFDVLSFFYVDEDGIMEPALVVDDGSHDWTHFEFTFPKTGDYTLAWLFEKQWYEPIDDDMTMIDDIELVMHETAPLESLELAPAKSKILVGEKALLNVVYNPAWVESTEVTFESSDESVATVNEKGVVTAVSEGKATITATYVEDETKTAEAEVEVITPITVPEMNFVETELGATFNAVLDDQNAEYVLFDDFSVKFAVGYKFNLEDGQAAYIDVAPGEGEVVPNDTQLYVYDEDFNMVAFNDDNDEGLYSTLKFMPEEGGTYYAVVTTFDSYFWDGGSVTVTIDEYIPVHVKEVVVPETMTVGLGKYMKLDYSLVPEENDYPEVVFDSSDEYVVTVNENGTLYGVAEGTAEVTVTNVESGISATTLVTVEVTENPKPDGMIYAYDLAEYGDELWYGFVQYDPETNDIVNVAEYDATGYLAGTYYNGTLYAYCAENMFFYYDLYYTIIDVETYQIVDAVYMDTTYLPYDMTYDYSTGTAYATLFNMFDESDNQLAEIDLETGDMNPVAAFDPETPALFLAADAENLYAMSPFGMLYSVDKKTAEMTEIRDTGIECFYVGTMVYNYEDELMYWFPLDEVAFVTHALAFDPATGEVSSEDSMPKGPRELTFGFTYYEPTEFTVTFLGYEHEIVAEVTVARGQAAEAPDMTREGLTFGLWDKDFSNVTSDLYVQGYYLGDTNMNAMLDAGDGTQILRAAVGMEALEGDSLTLANVNGNDEPHDAGDATLVLRFVVGLSNEAE